MKKKFNLRNVAKITLACLTGFLMFSACGDDNNTTANNNSSDNYWEQSPLVWMQLKGKVKTVTQSGTTTTFDEKGRIISVENDWNGKMNYVYNASGQLTDDGEHTYAYGTHGKYVPRFDRHWNEPMGALVKNLKSVTPKDEFGNNISCTFNGNTLAFKMDQGGEWSLTVDIPYEGNYPKGYENTEMVVSAKYAANGMFTEYYEGFKTPAGIVHWGGRYFYKQDGNFMLVDKKTEYQIFNDQPVTNTITYTYNDKKDVEKEVYNNYDGSESQVTYTYVYDTNGNWTKKTTNWGDGNPFEETRTITYY